MSKTLVTYFSVGGATAKYARYIAKQTNAELFEIKPQIPYSEADIKWTNPLARCNKEKIGKKDVPIEGFVENFNDYDTVLIGFPIWYSAAPNAVNTFVKGYDWSGKKIAIFTTSGGGGLGKTAEKLSPYLNGKGEIVDAKLFRPSEKAPEIKEWLKSIGL